MSSLSKKEEDIEFEATCFVVSQGIGGLETGLKNFFETRPRSAAIKNFVEYPTRNGEIDKFIRGVSSIREQIKELMNLLELDCVQNNQFIPKPEVKFSEKHTKLKIIRLIRRGITRCISELEALSGRPPKYVLRVFQGIHQKSQSRFKSERNRKDFKEYWRDRLSAILTMSDALDDLINGYRLKVSRKSECGAEKSSAPDTPGNQATSTTANTNTAPEIPDGKKTFLEYIIKEQKTTFKNPLGCEIAREIAMAIEDNGNGITFGELLELFDEVFLDQLEKLLDDLKEELAKIRIELKGDLKSGGEELISLEWMTSNSAQSISKTRGSRGQAKKKPRRGIRRNGVRGQAG